MCLIKDWPPELPLTVAATIPPASRLIADVQLGNGFPLMLGVAGSDREQNSTSLQPAITPLISLFISRIHKVYSAGYLKVSERHSFQNMAGRSLVLIGALFLRPWGH